MNAYAEGALLVVSLLGIFALAGVAFGVFGAIAWAVGKFVFTWLVGA